MDKFYLIETQLEGQIVNYPLKDGTLCFILNKKISEIAPIEELILDCITSKISYNKQLLFRVNPDIAYLNIKTIHDELTLEIEVKHYNGRVNLLIKDTDECINEFLALNFAGEDVKMNYCQSNSQEYLQKYLLEKNINSTTTQNTKKLKV
jgi:hypothetical protein